MEGKSDEGCAAAAPQSARPSFRYLECMALLRLLLLILLTPIILVVKLLTWPFRRGFSNVVDVRADDPGMLEAIATARRTSPQFLAWLDAHPEDDSLALKAALPATSGSVEHVWMIGIRREGTDALSGTIENVTSTLAGHTTGDRVTVKIDEITDWKYIEDGVMQGGHTIRFFLAQMPRKQRERMLAALPFRIEGIPARG